MFTPRIGLLALLFLTLSSTGFAGGYQSRLYVDSEVAISGGGSSWGDAIKYLQDAITEAQGLNQQGSGPVEIWVARGIHYTDQDLGNPAGSGNRNRSFNLYDSITMYGGFKGDETSLSQRPLDVLTGGPNATLLSGPVSAGGAYHVVDGSFAIGNNPTHYDVAQLNGFIVAHGNADGAGSKQDGAGFYSSFGRQRIANCLFANNHAVDEGGAVYVDGVDTHVDMFNCIVRGNTAFLGGGVYTTGGSYFLFAHGTVVENGEYTGGGSPTGGGGAQHNGAGTEARYYSSTLYGNLDSLGAHFDVTNSAELLFGNCILWGGESSNGNSDVGFTTGNVTFSDCIVEGGTTLVEQIATGSITLQNDFLSSDPDFLNAPIGNYGIFPSSPGVDMGSNGWVHADRGDIDQDGDTSEKTPLDLALNPRLVGAAYDFGAYEVGCVAVNYCASSLNSSGSNARMAWQGSCRVSEQDLTLIANGVPNTPGIFFFGSAQNQVPFGDSLLCLTSNIKRLTINFGSSNTLSYTVDWNHPAIASNFLPGNTRFIQAWFRDVAAGGAGYSTSDGLAMTFTN